MKAILLTILAVTSSNVSAQETQESRDNEHYTPGFPIFGIWSCWWCQLVPERNYDTGYRAERVDTKSYLNSTPFTRDARNTKFDTQFNLGGTVDVDWKRYRNHAWNLFLTEKDMASERRFPADNYINFEIWGAP